MRETAQKQPGKTDLGGNNNLGTLVFKGEPAGSCMHLHGQIKLLLREIKNIRLPGEILMIHGVEEFSKSHKHVAIESPARAAYSALDALN